MIVSSDEFIFDIYDDRYLNRLSELLLRSDVAGFDLCRLLYVRTWLETVPVNCHHKFAGWLLDQDGKVIDVWLKLADCRCCAPWLRSHLMELEYQT